MCQLSEELIAISWTNFWGRAILFFYPKPEAFDRPTGPQQIEKYLTVSLIAFL